MLQADCEETGLNASSRLRICKAILLYVCILGAGVMLFVSCCDFAMLLRWVDSHAYPCIINVETPQNDSRYLCTSAVLLIPDTHIVNFIYPPPGFPHYQLFSPSSLESYQECLMIEDGRATVFDRQSVLCNTLTVFVCCGFLLGKLVGKYTQ